MWSNKNKEKQKKNVAGLLCKFLRTLTGSIEKGLLTGTVLNLPLGRTSGSLYKLRDAPPRF